jgi:hypothetical protein
MTANKNRQVGKGMKARNKEANKVNDAAAEQATVSATTVHQEVAEKPVAEVISMLETPCTLETKPLQNLELQEGEPETASMGLEELMRRSQEAAKSVVAVEGDKEPEIAAGKFSVMLEEPEGLRESREKHPLLQIKNGNIEFVSTGLGEQPDGSYRVAVTIPEGYLSAVQDWAAAEQATVEQWMDNQFLAFMESYGAPARSR